ncbi:hypothetical protein BGZ91_005522 [Linnemannia elongata]|nr:hypothetical protein BGZ91_005522 [Linnemannia elongata]
MFINTMATQNMREIVLHLREAQAPATACSSWIITMDGEFQYEFKQHGSKRYHGNKHYSDEQHRGG